MAMTRPPGCDARTACNTAPYPTAFLFASPQNPLLWSLVAALVVNLSGLRAFLDPDRWGGAGWGLGVP